MSQRSASEQFRRSVVLHAGLWAILVALVTLSLGLAFVPLGSFNLLVAVAIAVVQVAVLSCFFMSLREASSLILITSGSGFVFLLAMVVLTLNDVLSRV